MAQSAVTPWIDTLETDPDHSDEWHPETGQPGVDLFSNALSVWAWAQGRAQTVNEAAAAFNVTPDIIRQAVENHYWMFLNGDRIEHDGD